MEMVKGVVIPTLIRGTEAEEKDKALRCLESKNFALSRDVDGLKLQVKRQKRIIAELEKWTLRTFVAVATVDAAIVIALFFALAR
nr:MAG TPA: hypothetical protein [Caudoviricetes sp.]